MKSQAQGRKRFRRILAVVGAVALTTTAACAAKVGEEAPQQIQTEKQHHFKSPVTRVIDAARMHGDLTVEQEQVLAEIEAEIDVDREARRALHDKLKHSAVAVVRAGSADSEEFQASVAEIVNAVEQHVAQSSDALDEIHALLEPDQRAAVADALRAHIDEKFGRKRQRDERRRDGFQRFAEHLMLSTLQVEQLKTMKKELIGDARGLRPTRDELHALVDAFEGDDFRAALDAFHAKKSRIFRARIARAGEKTDTVLAVFTPEQRELLADLILEGPSKVLYGEEAPAQE